VGYCVPSYNPSSGDETGERLNELRVEPPPCSTLGFIENLFVERRTWSSCRIVIAGLSPPSAKLRFDREATGSRGGRCAPETGRRVWVKSKSSGSALDLKIRS